MQIFEEKHCYMRIYSYFCRRVSSALCAGACYKGLILIKES